VITLNYRKIVYIVFGAVPAGFFLFFSYAIAVGSINALVNGAPEEWSSYGIPTVMASWGACAGYIVGVSTIMSLPLSGLSMTQKVLLIALITSGIGSMIWLFIEFGLDDIGDPQYFKWMATSVFIVSILLIAELWYSPNKSLNTDASDAGAG
jgi:hypothetical protein